MSIPRRRLSRLATPALGVAALCAVAPTGALANTVASASTFKPSTATLTTSTAATRSITLPEAATSVSIRAKGTSCASVWPSIGLKVDKVTVASVSVKSSTYADFTLKAAVTAGKAHTISLVLKNPSAKGASCIRTAKIDTTTFVSGSVVTPPVVTPPVVTPPVVTPPVVKPPVTTPPVVTPPVVTPPATTPPVVTPPVVTPPVVTPPPTTPPVVTPPPVSPGVGKLRYAPPVLTNPTTITLGTGATSTTMDTTKDYIIKMPAGVKDATTLKGGRNVVMIGGNIHVSSNSSAQRGIYIQGNVGTVHIEGVNIDDSGSQDTDGIAINAPLSSVQIENVRIVGITGTQAAWHGDVVQPWGGVKSLKIDRLSGRSNYQGLFLRPDQGPIGSIDLSNIDLSYDNVGLMNGGYLLWLTTGCDTAPVTMSEVYMPTLKTGKSLGTSIWPDTNSGGTCAPKVTTASSLTSATWPTLPVTGVVKSGMPTGGEFVPSGKAGSGYATPGYGA